MPRRGANRQGELNGQFLARNSGDAAMQAQDVIEAGLIYDGELSEMDVLAALVGVTGTCTTARARSSASRWRGWQAGASMDLSGLKVGGSYADERVGARGGRFFTAGIGWATRRGTCR